MFLKWFLCDVSKGKELYFQPNWPSFTAAGLETPSSVGKQQLPVSSLKQLFPDSHIESEENPDKLESEEEVSIFQSYCEDII